MAFHATHRTSGLIAAAVLLALAAPAAAEPVMDGPYIVNDLDAARAEARKSGKPIFVVFRCER